MKLQEVILRAIAGKITWLQAADIAGLSPRTINSLQRRYREFGYNGLYRQQGRKRHVYNVPLLTAEQIFALYQQHGGRLSVPRFHRKLQTEYDIRISDDWLKQALEGAGLVPRAPVSANGATERAYA
jgi:transposase